MVSSKAIQVSDVADDFATVVRNWYPVFVGDGDDWGKIYVSGEIRHTDKARFVFMHIVNPGNMKEDGSCDYMSIYNFEFWCPEKFIKIQRDKYGNEGYTVPRWFLKSKIEEYINQPLF